MILCIYIFVHTYDKTAAGCEYGLFACEALNLQLSKFAFYKLSKNYHVLGEPLAGDDSNSIST